MQNTAFECQICLEAYSDSGDHVPLILPCGHTFCKSCLELRFTSVPSCPVDNQRCSKAISQLTKNYSLIAGENSSRTRSPTTLSLEELEEEILCRKRSEMKKRLAGLEDVRRQNFKKSQEVKLEIEGLESQLEEIKKNVEGKKVTLASYEREVISADREIMQVNKKI